MQFRPYPGAAALKIHSGWLAQALADIGHSELRQAILASARFSDRIITRLAAVKPTSAPIDPDAPVARLAALLKPTFLEGVGQLWCAPIVARDLMAPSSHHDHGIDDRDQLRRMLRYRDHASADAIGQLSSRPDYASEGEACVAAWLTAQKCNPVAARLRLVLAPDVPPGSKVRIALVDRVLADPDCEGI